MDDDGFTKKWEGYSDYQFISRRMGIAIDDAVDAYSSIHSLHRENAKIKPEHAAQARKKILSAAIRVLVELENQTGDGTSEDYEEILGRWQDSDEVDGYLSRLEDTSLQYECPSWLHQMVVDIRTAGWQLGYLQAGRETREPTENTPETNAKQMFENL